MIGEILNKKESGTSCALARATRIFRAMRRRGGALNNKTYIYIMYGKRDIF